MRFCEQYPKILHITKHLFLNFVQLYNTLPGVCRYIHLKITSRLVYKSGPRGNSKDEIVSKEYQVKQPQIIS